MTMNKKTQIKTQIMPLCQNSILMSKKKKEKQANNVSRIHSSQPSHIHPFYNDNATAAKSATTKPIVAPLFNLPPALSP